MTSLLLALISGHALCFYNYKFKGMGFGLFVLRFWGFFLSQFNTMNRRLDSQNDACTGVTVS